MATLVDPNLSLSNVVLVFFIPIKAPYPWRLTLPLLCIHFLTIWFYLEGPLGIVIACHTPYSMVAVPVLIYVGIHILYCSLRFSSQKSLSRIFPLVVHYQLLHSSFKIMTTYPIQIHSFYKPYASIWCSENFKLSKSY